MDYVLKLLNNLLALVIVLLPFVTTGPLDNCLLSSTQISNCFQQASDAHTGFEISVVINL